MSERAKIVKFPDVSVSHTNMFTEKTEMPYDSDRADRQGAILLGIIEDNRSEFDRRRDEAEYLKEQEYIDELITSVLSTLEKE